MVSQALNLLLRGSGYDTRLIEANPDGLADGPLDGTDLLLLAPGLTNRARITLLSIVRGDPKPVHALVLTLSTTIGEVLDDESGTLLVPWPSPVAVLAQQIEAILHSGTKEEGRDRLLKFTPPGGYDPKRFVSTDDASRGSPAATHHLIRCTCQDVSARDQAIQK